MRFDDWIIVNYWILLFCWIMRSDMLTQHIWKIQPISLPTSHPMTSGKETSEGTSWLNETEVEALEVRYSHHFQSINM